MSSLLSISRTTAAAAATLVLVLISTSPAARASLDSSGRAIGDGIDASHLNGADSNPDAFLADQLHRDQVLRAKLVTINAILQNDKMKLDAVHKVIDSVRARTPGLRNYEGPTLMDEDGDYNQMIEGYKELVAYADHRLQVVHRLVDERKQGPLLNTPENIDMGNVLRWSQQEDYSFLHIGKPSSVSLNENGADVILFARANQVLARFEAGDHSVSVLKPMALKELIDAPCDQSLPLDANLVAKILGTARSQSQPISANCVKGDKPGIRISDVKSEIEITYAMRAPPLSTEVVLDVIFYQQLRLPLYPAPADFVSAVDTVYARDTQAVKAGR